MHVPLPAEASGGALTTPPHHAPSATVAGQPRPLGASFWGPLTAMAGVFVGALALMVALPADLHKVMSECSQLVCYLVAAWCCAWVAARSPDARLRQTWRWSAAAFGSMALAEAIYAYLLLFQHIDDPFPSPADAFYLLFYVLIAIGLSRLPAARVTGFTKVKLALDAALITGGLLSVSWLYLIGPLYFGGADTPLALAISLAYPVGDLVVLVALVVLLMRGVHEGFKAVYLWLIAGMLCFVYADSAYTYLGLQNAYVDGMLSVDPFWELGTLLMALAPLYQLARFGESGQAWAWLTRHRQAESTGQGQPSESLTRVVLPYVPVVVLFALIWQAQATASDQRLFPGLYGLAVLSILLVVVRQALVVRQSVQATQHSMLHMMALQDKAAAQLEQQRQEILEHARLLEEGIQRMIETQARVAHGDYSARVHHSGKGALFPMATMLNLMLERIEQRMRQSASSEQVAALALRQAQLCARAAEGDARVLEELLRPTGTPLDATAQLIASLRRRVTELEGSHPRAVAASVSPPSSPPPPSSPSPERALDTRVVFQATAKPRSRPFGPFSRLNLEPLPPPVGLSTDVMAAP